MHTSWPLPILFAHLLSKNIPEIFTEKTTASVLQRFWVQILSTHKGKEGFEVKALLWKLAVKCNSWLLW